MSPKALDAAAPFTAPTPIPDAAPGNTLLRQLLSRPTALAALALLCIILTMAVFAPAFSPRPPDDVDITRKFEAPSLEEPLGTDHLGRSVLARLCHGTRVSLFAVGAILACIVAVGLTAGCVAGYAGGRVDSLLMRACDVFMTFPTFILALFLVGVLGSGLTNVIIAVACTHWAWYARFARGLVLGLKQREYVLAARAAGTRPARLVLRHILPPVLAQMLVMAGLDVGHMLLHVSGLSFLGLGVRPPTPEWGVMIGDAREYIGTHPELLLYPGLMIFVTVMAFNLLGDALRDALDPAAARETEGDAACTAHAPDGVDDTDGMAAPEYPDAAGNGPVDIDEGRTDACGGGDMNGMAPALATSAPGPVPALAVRGLELRRASRTADTETGTETGTATPALPDPALDPPLVGPVDLTVERGQVVCLVGPSGCGKSLTCMALLGMLPDGVARTAGTIRVNGQTVDRQPPEGHAAHGALPERLRLLRGRGAAYVLQNPASCFDPVFTIGAHFQETLAAHLPAAPKDGPNGTRRPDWHTAALAALREVGFDDAQAILRHYPFQMSGGMLQRVMIALALVLDVPLLIADEPTTDLDLPSQAHVLDLLDQVRRTRNMAILLVTHDLSVAARMADRMAVMRHGRVVEQGDVHELFNAPRHPYTRALLAAHHRLYGLRPPLAGGAAPQPLVTSSAAAGRP